MGNNRQEHISKLFEIHSQNLHSVCPTLFSTYVCPICLNTFSKDEIDKLDTGHVWPEFLRSTGEYAKHQQVLLCSTCNSRAGGRGDAAMQEFAKTREGEKTGNPHKPRKVIIKPVNNLLGEPAQLKAFVIEQPDNRVILQFRRRRKENHWHNDPREMEKFSNYFKQGTCDIIIYPHDVNVQLAFAGWLTSAYLMTFYAFGYRYIFQNCLDPVRQYIIDSAEGQVDNRLQFDETKTNCVQICGTHLATDPALGFVSPLDGNTPYIEVSFLDFHVRLPTKYTYLPNKNLFPNDPDACGVVINGTNHFPHEDYCHWEILFGHPDFWLEAT